MVQREIPLSELFKSTPDRRLVHNILEVVTVKDYWGSLLKSRDVSYLGLIYRVPPRLWRGLSQTQRELREVDPEQLYAKQSTFHVTVKGLGYLEEKLDHVKYEKVMQKISSIIAEFKPFEIRIKGLGVFPTSVYASVEDQSSRFKAMNNRICEELRGDVEQSEYDGDAYVPHVTLATFNSSDVKNLFEKISSPEMRDRDFGTCAVFEIEAVEVNMLLALGPEETQEGAFTYVRSFHLG
ncbi:MAG TPA: 2'-5' RNA ligase family protein [Nitrososphaerales archaeon]|nr:2'-5' RNA ligase family protein [Nitrososphaerales archaeon]